MRRSLAVWIFFRVSKLYILLWIRRSRDDCGRNSGRGKPSHALRFTDADDECMESMIQPTWRATMDRVRQVFLEFPRSNSILICSLLCPRAPLSPSSPTWATRGILHHQPRERLGSKNAMLCNQFLGAHKDMARPASSWSANCGGRHHLRRSYSSGSPTSLSAASTQRPSSFWRLARPHHPREMVGGARQG
jgi:hypothetical protein